MQYNSWYTGAGPEGTGKKRSRPRRSWGKVGDGRAEGPPAIGNGGPAAMSLMPDDDETNVHVF